jgi:hypothetical protein
MEARFFTSDGEIVDFVRSTYEGHMRVSDGPDGPERVNQTAWKAGDRGFRSPEGRSA